MNILLITNEVDKTNGWATVGVELANEMRRSHDVTIISRKGDAKNVEYDLISSDKYRNPITLMADVYKITRKLNTINVDIIICNIEPYLPLAVILKKLLGNAKLILIGHGTYIYFPFVHGTQRFLNRWLARQVDLIIVPSKFTYSKARTWWKGPLEVINWGVNTADYYPIHNIEKEQSFICVGSLKDRKGIDTLFRAFAQILATHPNIKLYLTGKQTPKTLKLSEELCITKNIVFTGRVSHAELLKYYSRSLCHVLVSVNTRSAFEGFGLVHLEANACGIPSIGATDSANEDIIIDGYNGYLCTQQDHGMLAVLLLKILEDGPNYERMRANSLRHAANYSWHDTATKLLSSALRYSCVVHAESEAGSRQ